MVTSMVNVWFIELEVSDLSEPTGCIRVYLTIQSNILVSLVRINLYTQCRRRDNRYTKSRPWAALDDVPTPPSPTVRRVQMESKMPRLSCCVCPPTSNRMALLPCLATLVLCQVYHYHHFIEKTYSVAFFVRGVTVLRRRPVLIF